MTGHTPAEIAEWMLAQLTDDDWLYQQNAVSEIEQTFGEEFVYANENGNPAIDRRVLRAFRKISEDTVVWDRWAFAWRLKTADDGPGRKIE